MVLRSDLRFTAEFLAWWGRHESASCPTPKYRLRSLGPFIHGTYLTDEQLRPELMIRGVDDIDAQVTVVNVMLPYMHWLVGRLRSKPYYLPGWCMSRTVQPVCLCA